MPEYFFHIRLELLPSTGHTFPTQTPAPIDLTYAFKALRPFIRSSTLRTPSKTTLRSHHIASGGRDVARYNPGPSKGVSPDPEQTESSNDHRTDKIEIVCADMESLHTNGTKTGSSHNHIGKGIGNAVTGKQTRGRYEPLSESSLGQEWGIVHLYRDAAETPGLYRDSQHQNAWTGGSGAVKHAQSTYLPPAKDDECTTLCILAVPSYLTPADFLAFVGENTRNNVSHFRMIKTARANRYMVLMKFKHGRVARDWQHEWNGKVFNSMEPETCHVVFLKSVEITQPENTVGDSTLESNYNGTSTYPRMNNDPFGATTSGKPPAPPTPALIELPTCPVCLERMDETAGLLTILCQHVFHCTCLQKWSGGGCPVCRYTHDDFSSKGGPTKYKSKLHNSEYDLLDEPLCCEHEGCLIEDSLWQCLICGKVGCGRYAGKHAYKHFEETGHTFSMDLVNKRVWDYAADVYVHRIIQDAAKPGEKLVELPGSKRAATATALEADDDVEVAKMENVALEYTHLLTSQLDSQRVYFEEIVERAVDKASQAAKLAERANIDCEQMQHQYDALTSEHDDYVNRILPELQNNKTRLEKRSSKFEEMAKSVNAKYLEEKSLASSLMERIKHIEETEIVSLQKKIKELEEENATKSLLMEGLQDEHRDAMFQLSAQDRLKEMVDRGEIDQADLTGATITTGPAKRSSNYGKSKPQASNTLQRDTGTGALQHLLNIWLDDDDVYQLGPKWDEKRAVAIVQNFRKDASSHGLSSREQKWFIASAMLEEQLLVLREKTIDPKEKIQTDSGREELARIMLPLIGLDPEQYQVGSEWDPDVAEAVVKESRANAYGKNVQSILEEYRQKLLDDEVIIPRPGSEVLEGSTINPAQCHSRSESTVSTLCAAEAESDLKSLLPVMLLLNFEPSKFQAGPNWTPDVADNILEKQVMTPDEASMKHVRDKLLIKGLIMSVDRADHEDFSSAVAGKPRQALSLPDVPAAAPSNKKKKNKGKKGGKH